MLRNTINRVKIDIETDFPLKEFRLALIPLHRQILQADEHKMR